MRDSTGIYEEPTMENSNLGPLSNYICPQEVAYYYALLLYKLALYIFFIERAGEYDGVHKSLSRAVY